MKARSWLAEAVQQKSPIETIGLSLSAMLSGLDVADDVGEDVADSRAEEGQNDDDHDGN